MVEREENKHLSCLLNILSAMSGTQLLPASIATYVSSCSSKASQPPSCTTSHLVRALQVGPAQHIHQPESSCRESHWCAKCGTQHQGSWRQRHIDCILHTSSRLTCLCGRGRGKTGMGLGPNLLSGFFNFFSQFYTTQALGIHLASYCCSP